MLNKNNERELAYLVKIDSIEPIIGSDNCEAAVIGGWRVMVKKNTFKPGDIAVYFEIDSLVDLSKDYFAFMSKYKGKVKTQKYTFGGKGKFISQGLIMSPTDFGWYAEMPEANKDCVMEPDHTLHFLDDESRFLTKRLNVIYYEPEDNIRKAATVDKYKKMAQRYPKVFSKPFIRWLMKYEIGKKILFIFFGKKKDRSGWPAWVQKTDEERVQNMPYILNDKSEWIATEKIDGTSTTFTMKRKRFGKNEFYVCSRNVVFDKPDKNCYYDTNVYTEMAEKYNVEKVLASILSDNPQYEWITLQGETYGGDIQKRNYSTKNHDFVAFNFITSTDGRWNSVKARDYMKQYGINWVPIINEHFILPDTVDELLNIATDKSVIDGGMREGLVFRSLDGTKSFKAVSNEFLIKYHL